MTLTLAMFTGYYKTAKYELIMSYNKRTRGGLTVVWFKKPFIEEIGNFKIRECLGAFCIASHHLNIATKIKSLIKYNCCFQCLWMLLTIFVEKLPRQIISANHCWQCLDHSDSGLNPYPEPVYTGWSSVHWNATGMPLDDPVYTGIPLDHPANTCRVHWNTTGKT